MPKLIFKVSKKAVCYFLCKKRKKHYNKFRIVFYSAVINKLTKITGDIKTMILVDTQEVDLAIKPVDKKGNAAQVEGVPVWVSSDPTVIEIIPSTDGLSAVAKAGILGQAQVSVTVDADLGEGVRNISGVLDFDVVAGEAVSLSVITSAPREQV